MILYSPLVISPSPFHLTHSTHLISLGSFPVWRSQSSLVCSLSLHSMTLLLVLVLYSIYEDFACWRPERPHFLSQIVILEKKKREKKKYIYINMIRISCRYPARSTIYINVNWYTIIGQCNGGGPFLKEGGGEALGLFTDGEFTRAQWLELKSEMLCMTSLDGRKWHLHVPYSPTFSCSLQMW